MTRGWSPGGGRRCPINLVTTDGVSSFLNQNSFAIFCSKASLFKYLKVKMPQMKDTQTTH